MRTSCRTAVAAALLSLIAAGGCGPSKGTVTGKVTHKGKTVASGGVTLVASDNLAYSGQISPDGTFSIPNVPGGPVKIAVTSPNPAGGGRAGGGRGGGLVEAGGGEGQPQLPPGMWFAIPEKYGDPNQSGLTGTVNGDTTINLDLP